MRIAVIGAGVVGLAVTHELVRRGAPVDCYEADVPMAARSCGDTRIFRLAHDRPELVDWAARAHRRWQDWSRDAGLPLVGTHGTVVSGDVDRTAAAMAAAGARFDVRDTCPTLPATDPEGPFLVDPLGGVIRAAETGRFLRGHVDDRVIRRRVEALEPRADGVAVLTAGDVRSYDSVVVAAGAGTAALAGPLGIDVPTRLEHHVRHTFPLRDPAAVPPCWLDRSGARRAEFTTYGQLAGAGRWAIGGHLPDADTDWALDRDEAVRRARAALVDRVAERVSGCRPDPVDLIHCDVTVGLGDGLSAARRGPVLALWGDNLFKFAPVIGDVVADAAVHRSLPDALVAVASRGSGLTS